MYDSRSSHPRNRGSRYIRDEYTRYCCTKPLPSKREALAEAIIALTDPDMPAASLSRQIERDHDEALLLNGLPAWERELILMFEEERTADSEYTEWHSDEQIEQAEIWRAWEKMEAERQREEEAQYDDDFGGYTSDDCWLPLATTMQECREIFGGTDFIIQHTNVVRRTA